MNKSADSMKCNCKFSVYPILFGDTVVLKIFVKSNTVVCKAKKSQHIANY